MSAETNSNHRPEANSEIPYMIRGHHAPSLMADTYTLYKNNLITSASQFIKEGIKDQQKLRQTLFEWESGYPRGWGEDYKKDVMGSTEAERLDFLSKFTNARLQFFTKSGKSDVYITTLPDAICGSCVLGAHCLVQMPSEHDRKSVYDIYVRFYIKGKPYKIIEPPYKSTWDAHATLKVNLGDLRQMALEITGVKKELEADAKQNSWLYAVYKKLSRKSTN